MRDYGELVKELRESAEWADRLAVLMGRDVGDSKAPLMRKAADAIEELLADNKEILYRVEIAENMIAFYQEGKPLPNVPKWNPASKPPKEKGDYWCNVRSFNFDDTYYQHEVWFDGECFVIDGVCTERVTHWMPLPAPPKEEELNKNVE